MTFTEEELKAACEMTANKTADLLTQKLAALAEKFASLMASEDGARGLRAFAAVLRDDLGLDKPEEAA